VNFDLSEDEEMLKALAERFVTDRYDPERRRSYLQEDIGFSSQNWALLGELGLISAAFGTDDGGLGIGPSGLMTAFEALGNGLVVEPLVENVVLAGGLFARLASPDLKAKWMDGLLTGEKRLALAHREAGARRNEDWVETLARHNGSSASLSGAKSTVPAGEGVDAYIISARTAGRAGDAAGVSLYLVDARAPGLTVRPWRLVDGSVAVSLTLDNVQVSQSCYLGGGTADIAREQARASLFRAAEALGIMERLFANTLDYLRTRQQFGAPLGTFQALQHRMAAQYANIEQARALLNLAAMADSEDQLAWHRAVDGARAFIAEASIALGHEAIQMHGGMGVTDELVIGHGHKRLLMLSRWPDSAAEALDRYAGVTGRPLIQSMPRRSRS
jgi:hypothetical protein